jgi:hypothetical protein
MQNRRCTDCLFLLVFIAFLGGMGYMTALGYIEGDVQYMLAPIAQSNSGPIVCGYDTAVDYPVLYIANLQAAASDFKNFFTYGTCAN